jgi:hypothetical protein
MMTAKQVFSEMRKNQGAEDHQRSVDAFAANVLGDGKPTPEQLQALPIAAVLRLYGETEDAETLVSIELSLQERDAEVREHIAYIVEQASDMRIRAEGWSEYAKAKARHAKDLADRADRVLAVATGYMVRTGEAQLEAGPHVLTLRQNPGRVEVTVPQLLPPEYMRQKVTTEPDKTAIKKALASGMVIDGCELVQSWRLDIK